MFFYYQLYRLVVASIKSINLFFVSKKLWPTKSWLQFWFSSSKENQIAVGNLSFFVRSNNFGSKFVDLYMIKSCIVDKQYDHQDFVLSQCKIIIDIGAHIGAFSIYAAASAKDALVLSFEPSPENYSQFKKNIELNKLTNIRSFQKAVAAHSGKISFYYDPINSASHSIVKSSNNPIFVESTTLKDIFSEFKIEYCDFLKMDCEGAEYEILFNTPADIFKRINRITLECHNPLFYDIKNPEYTPENLISYLSEAGFEAKILKEHAIQGMIWAKRK